MTAESNSKILNIPILDPHDDPPARDVDPGRRLGMQPPHSIRHTILRHIEALQRYGVGRTVHVSSLRSDAGTANSTECYPKEWFGFCLCQFSRASRVVAVRRTLIAAFLERRQGGNHGAPAGVADVITGPFSIPNLCPGTVGLYWRGHSIDTDLSRLDTSQDRVALLPDGSVDNIRLAGPPDGIDGRQSITNRSLDPDSNDATPVMVIFLCCIVSDASGSVH